MKNDSLKHRIREAEKQRHAAAIDAAYLRETRPASVTNSYLTQCGTWGCENTRETVAENVAAALEQLRAAGWQATRESLSTWVANCPKHTTAHKVAPALEVQP